MADALLDLIIPRYRNNYYPKLLRRRVLGVITIGVFAVNVLSFGIGGGVFAGTINSSRLVELANQERAAAGLGALSSESRLTAAAHAKAQHIFEYQYWSHYGPNGETPWQFITASGYSYVYAGENLAKGFNSSEAVHSAWMASKTHRDNIMNGNYRNVGIAVVPGTLQGSEVVLVVQMFGSLTETAPPPIAEGQTEPEYSTTVGVTVEEPVSIEITYPEDDSVVADNEFTMFGSASGDISSVTIVDNGKETEGVILEDGAWDYRPDAGWVEGDHDISVRDDEERGSGTVHFEVDTVPPAIDEPSLRVSKINESSNVIEIAVFADESAEEVLFVSDDFSMTLVFDEGSGMFEGIVSDGEFGGDSAKIVASDKVGNTSEVDVTDMVLGELTVREGNQSGSVTLESGGVAKLITRVAVVLIGILLMVDIYFLFRLNIIHTRGKTLFPLALWVMVLVVGLIIGPGGTIL